MCNNKKLSYHNYCKTVPKNAIKKACIRPLTFKVIQVTGIGANQWAAYDFLLVFHCNYASISYHFPNSDTYL